MVDWTNGNSIEVSIYRSRVQFIDESFLKRALSFNVKHINEYICLKNKDYNFSVEYDYYVKIWMFIYRCFLYVKNKKLLRNKLTGLLLVFKSKVNFFSIIFSVSYIYERQVKSL